jgi:S-phase kinase-associated protein 1
MPKLVASKESPPYVRVIPAEQARMSELIKSMMEDDDPDEDEEEIPLIDLGADQLDRVIRFMEHHVHNPMKKIEKPIKTNNLGDFVEEWDVAFTDFRDAAGEVDWHGVFNMALAANYLHMTDMLDLFICKIACGIKGKSAQEVQRMFNIPDDLTPEEEKIVRMKNGWLFDITEPAASASATAATTTGNGGGG